jgi:hypothetical protein
MNLRELLKNWEDQDVSAYFLACCLGLIEYEASLTKFREMKHIFWTGNQTSDFLYNMLQKMSEVDILEFDDKESKYRWNQTFEQF